MSDPVLRRRTTAEQRSYLQGVISTLRTWASNSTAEQAAKLHVQADLHALQLAEIHEADDMADRWSDAIAVLEGRARWAILPGEMLTALRSLPTASVDALISDPPYSSGGAFRGDRMMDTTAKYVNSENAGMRPDFAGDNRDQRSFEFWCAMWLAECLRIAKPGAVCALFTDWRQLPSTTNALQAGGWVWRGVVPWDKTEATRPQMGRPRAQCEYIVWGSAGALAQRADVGVLPGLIRQIVDPDEKLHIAGKPIAVMSELARYCVPDGVILDPFCGSASTGVGALRRGRRFIGCEVDPHWVSVSDQRMAAEEQGSTIAQVKAGQTSMFSELEVAPPPDSTGAAAPVAPCPTCSGTATAVTPCATCGMGATTVAAPGPVCTCSYDDSEEMTRHAALCPLAGAF